MVIRRRAASCGKHGLIVSARRVRSLHKPSCAFHWMFCATQARCLPGSRLGPSRHFAALRNLSQWEAKPGLPPLGPHVRFHRLQTCPRGAVRWSSCAFASQRLLRPLSRTSTISSIQNHITTAVTIRNAKQCQALRPDGAMAATGAGGTSLRLLSVGVGTSRRLVIAVCR
jgi:hypothetical protein